MQQFEDSTIRRFVLGDIEEEGRRKLEAEAIADDDLFGRIEAIEDEIIEEYLAGRLPGSEQKIFRETLDAIPGRRQRVELASFLAARKPASTSTSNVVGFNARLRFASHARLAVAAGFAGAAILALLFVQSRQSASDSNPPAPAVAATPASIADPASTTQERPDPETSSAIAARQPTKPHFAPPTSTIDSLAAASVVTFVLSTGTSRSGDQGRTLDLAPGIQAVDFQIAVDDDEFSHYNAELRAPDGATVSLQRDIPVTALGDAPVIVLRVPASSFRDGRHELVIAGIHERGAEEVAYLEFDVSRR